MNRYCLALAAITLSALPALAHTGHLTDNGAGHEHVSGLLALGLIVGGLAGLAGIRLFRRLRARKA